MKDELFDIVSEEDEVVGRSERKEVHSKGHIHRSIFIFIFDKQGRIFVNQRTLNKEFYPGYWSIVIGGHVHSGESYEEAAEREVKEEMGIEGKPKFITSLKKRLDEKDRENVKVYAITTDKKPKLDSHELEQGKFLTMEQLDKKLKKEKFLPETTKLLEILGKITISKLQ